MKPQKQEVKFREFLKASARISELYGLIRDTPSIPLPKRIFAGHWRYFKVREDILRSSIGEQVSKVVNLCNSWVLGRKKEPSSYEHCYSAIYCKYYGETFVSKQHLHPVSQETIDKAGFSPKQIARWFEVSRTVKSFGSKNVEFCKYYPKVPEYMLEFAYKAAYITEEKVKVGAYESELAKLQQFMADNNGWKALENRHRDDWDLSLDKKRLANRLADKEIQEFYSETD